MYYTCHTWLTAIKLASSPKAVAGNSLVNLFRTESDSIRPVAFAMSSRLR